jgi:hypothetical protein
MDHPHQHLCPDALVEGAKNQAGFFSDSDFCTTQGTVDQASVENPLQPQTHSGLSFALGTLFGCLLMSSVFLEPSLQYKERAPVGHNPQYRKSLVELGTTNIDLEIRHMSPLNLQRQPTNPFLYNTEGSLLQPAFLQSYSRAFQEFWALASLSTSRLQGEHFFYDLPLSESLFHEAKTVKYYDQQGPWQDNTPHKNDNTRDNETWKK